MQAVPRPAIAAASTRPGRRTQGPQPQFAGLWSGSCATAKLRCGRFEVPAEVASGCRGVFELQRPAGYCHSIAVSISPSAPKYPSGYDPARAALAAARPAALLFVSPRRSLSSTFRSPPHHHRRAVRAAQSGAADHFQSDAPAGGRPLPHRCAIEHRRTGRAAILHRRPASPFSFLFLAPVLISATALPIQLAIALGGVPRRSPAPPRWCSSALPLPSRPATIRWCCHRSTCSASGSRS